MMAKENTVRMQSRMTRWGAWVIGLSLVMVGVGLARHDALQAAFGFAGLLMMGMSYLVGRLNVCGWEMNCEGAAVAHAGQVFLLRLWVKSKKRFLAGHGLHAKIAMVGGMKEEWSLPTVDPGEEHAHDVRMIPDQRASGQKHSVRWRSIFPLGLWDFERVGEMVHELTIFPQVARAKAGLLTGAMRDAAVLHGLSFGRGGGEWRGLRAWQAGDSAQRVHASASSRSHARGMGLMVREYDPPGHLPQRVIVLFHSLGRDGAMIRPEMFERALSHVCGVIKFLIEQSIPVTFVADFDHYLERRCDSRAQMIEVFHLLSRAQRYAGTEWHDLDKIKNDYQEEDFWIVISDMDRALWQRVFSSFGARCHCISPQGLRKK